MANLHLEYFNGKAANPSVMDQAILKYIEDGRKDYYDEDIVEDCHFQVWYQLSVLRTGLFSWYDFKEGASVLEIGAGFGGLTGLLCDKCKYVVATERSEHRAAAIVKRWQDKSNLDVYAGEWSEMDFGKKFDYIILTGILERSCGGAMDAAKYAAYLQKVSKQLKEDGILLAAVENRFGLKYFCGAKESHTGKAFDGINKYPAHTKGYSFSRQELKEIVEKSGFTQCKFYYPLPDYKLPQLIYTDACLPEKNLRERLIPYYTDKNSLVAVEKDLYDDVIANGVFPFFANSFLVECGVQARLDKAVYAAISTDRGREKSFATVIYEGKEVEKKPLFPEGEANAGQLCDNLQDLQEHGIPVIAFEKNASGIKMPFVEDATLSNYLKKLIREDKEEFIHIMDRLYAYILQSSEEVGADCNRLVERLQEITDDAEEKAKLQVLDWGPVLNRAYMELIPLNCFYNPRSKAMLFFDQEFVREQYPAKYVLFRAIHYIYCFTTDAERYIPKTELLKRYDLGDLWDYFLKEERLFLDEVRKHQLYTQFYRWAQVDKQAVYANARKLQSEEEKIAEYRVSDKMKKTWNVELQMLDMVDVICKKHNISYFMVHGTLLGALRHKGFIPWDDDLDIGMLRKDYERFLEVAPKELQEPFVLQNMWTEKDYFFGGITKLRNGNTTGIQVRELGHESNQGIWIDIIPFDDCTMDEKKLQIKEKKIKAAYQLLYAKVYGKDTKCFGELSPWKWKCCRLLASLRSHESLCRQMQNAINMYTEEETEQIAAFTGYGNFRMLQKADFTKTVSMEFAGRQLPAPVGYENYMFMLWGKDYMKYPPEEERKPKHTGIIDPERPYTGYVKMLTGMFEDVKGKKIILFGSGKMFEDYMKKWGARYRPDFLVDNDESKWDRKRMGIEIKPPKAILEIPPEKRRLIICSFYYKEIQKQLEEMGIRDYHVYVQHMEWILKSEEQR